MKFFGILASVLVTSVAAYPAPYPGATESAIVKRSPDSIIAALNNLSSAVVALNKSLNNFNPVSLTTVGGLLDVLKASDVVGNNIIATDKQINATGPLNSDDSLTVGLAFIDFIPTVQSLLTNIVVVRPKVDSVAALFSARKTVLSALVTDRSLTKQLTKDLVANLDSSLQDLGASQAQIVDDSFGVAIANYSRSIKGVELPAIPSNVRNGQVVNY